MLGPAEENLLVIAVMCAACLWVLRLADQFSSLVALRGAMREHRVSFVRWLGPKLYVFQNMTVAHYAALINQRQGMEASDCPQVRVPFMVVQKASAWLFLTSMPRSRR